MINKSLKKTISLYDKKIDSTGLAVFRTLYGIVLLMEAIHLFYFRHLTFDYIPYLEKAEIDFSIPILLWMVSIVMIIFGAFTRYATVLNYLLTVILIGTMKTFEYHVFYTYLGLNFLLIFLPVSQQLSLDRLFLKLKYSSAQFQYKPPTTVSQLYYFTPLIFGIAFVYFDSIFYKFTSTLWLNGIGMWEPANLPMISHLNLPFLSSSEILIKGLGYLTLVFELVFIFFFWVKKLRIPLLIIGVGLHLGILLEFPIPFFALSVIGLYSLLMPIKVWSFFKVKKRKSTLTFYYDAECPLCIRTKITIEHLDIFNKIVFKSVQFHAKDEVSLKDIEEEKLYEDIYSVDKKGIVRKGVDTYISVIKRIWYIAPLAYLIQLPGIYSLSKKTYAFVAKNRTTERCTDENCSYNIPALPEDRDEIKILQNLTIGQLKKVAILSLFSLLFILNSVSVLDTFAARTPYVKNSIASTIVKKVYDPFRLFNHTFFGITKHGVFMDGHFRGYNHIVSVYYLDGDKEIRLPIVTEEGLPDYYNYGSNWVKWTFRVVGPSVNQKSLNKGLRRFSAFWAYKNNIDLTDAKFIIKVKKIDSVSGWEEGFYEKQIGKPWVYGGYFEWKDNEFLSFVKEIESI